MENGLHKARKTHSETSDNWLEQSWASTIFLSFYREDSSGFDGMYDKIHAEENFLYPS